MGEQIIQQREKNQLSSNMALFQACLLISFCVSMGLVSGNNSETTTGPKIKPNIFTPKSILRPEYGILYEHLGQLYQGLQRYYLVIGIPLPTEDDIPDAYTDLSLNCDFQTIDLDKLSVIRDLTQLCVDFFPAITQKSTVLKRMQQQLKHKIHSDMPALLPNLVVNFHVQTPGQQHISPYEKVDEIIHLRDSNITKGSLGAVLKVVSGIVKGASIVGDIISGARSVGE